MKIKNYKELKDGGATIDMELTEKEVDILLNYAIKDILYKQLGLTSMPHTSA